ncbi:MAG: aminotransferase class V-fold PLP-dependent enzyme [Bacteroidetes bacterium]|nr:aminotransferase class V-fold PLP-dependent enzyme [Bacteroidota bacterium]
MLSCQSDKFFLSPDRHYLNCAFLSPLMKNVEAAGIEALQIKRDPSQVTPNMFFEDINLARRLFAKLINCPQDQVALIPSTSYGIATIARNLSIESGDNIVLIQDQFPSNVYAWRRLSKTTGATIHTVVRDHKRDWSQKIIESINQKTAVVAMETVHWANGYAFDLMEISKRTHDVGAHLILDGTQSIGAVHFDIHSVKPDALVCAGYKWLLGPYGTALLYVGERYMDGIPLEETWAARQGSDKFDQLVNYTDEYRSGATRFDRGQSCAFAQTAMMIKGLKQILEWDPAQIQSYCSELITDFLSIIQDHGYDVDDACLSHLFGLAIPDHLDRMQLSDQLKEANISVSLRGGSIRVSPNVYNRKADIHALQDVLLSAVK